MSTPDDAPDRGAHLPALLRLTSQLMAERLANWISESGFEGIQPAHSAVIQPLWEAAQGARITELAQRSRITKQSMSALVSDLESGGYVERVDDPDDARAIRVRLTSRGRAYARAVRAFARNLESEWAKRLGAKRVEELRDTLQLLRAALLESATAKAG